jgi:hypothetical protein
MGRTACSACFGSGLGAGWLGSDRDTGWLGVIRAGWLGSDLGGSGGSGLGDARSGSGLGDARSGSGRGGASVTSWPTGK